ncbi:hypothetical protein HDE_09850 [Halotydeus destructor]|nr:hypothetical protein HDE_09850 [Halotydeus destructor]
MKKASNKVCPNCFACDLKKSRRVKKMAAVKVNMQSIPSSSSWPEVLAIILLSMEVILSIAILKKLGSETPLGSAIDAVLSVTSLVGLLRGHRSLTRVSTVTFKIWLALDILVYVYASRHVGPHDGPDQFVEPILMAMLLDYITFKMSKKQQMSAICEKITATSDIIISQFVRKRRKE